MAVFGSNADQTRKRFEPEEAVRCSRPKRFINRRAKQPLPKHRLEALHGSNNTAGQRQSIRCNGHGVINSVLNSHHETSSPKGLY